MTDPNSSPLQSNFYDAQIYEIDIDKIYQDYIQVIDSRRSYVNIIGQNTTQLYQSIQGNSTATTTNNLVPSKSYQESRCHALYRIIGFPVVSNGKKMYNPGLDIVNPGNLSDKIGIASDPITDFIKLSNFREQYPLGNSKVFSNPTTVDAGALALSGGANPAGRRKFQAPFLLSSGVYDMDTNDQSYAGVFTSIVGEDEVDLTLYRDGSGNSPNLSNLPYDRFHIISPFIVDPRIDFTVSPASRKIGVPFVPDKSYLKISATDYVDVPILEIVIRDLYAVNNQLSSSGSFTQSFANFIKAIATAPDETILGQINQNDIQQLSQNSQFLQFLNIIQAMIIKLVEAEKNIAGAQSLYYWLPVTSTSGPEGGSTVQGVFLPDQQQPSLTTVADGNILKATAQSLFSQTNQNPQASAAQGIPDVGGFAVPLHNSMGPSSSSSFVNNSSQTLASLGAKRQDILSKAGDALRTVEIVMGEFSGLGLCDIIAVLASLYTMPPGDLLGFLDDDALARMNQQFNHNPPFTSPGIDQALTSLSSTVNQFYQLMDAIYDKVAGEQGLSV